MEGCIYFEKRGHESATYSNRSFSMSVHLLIIIMIIIITNFSPHVIHHMLCPCKKAQHFYFIGMIFMLLIVSYHKHSTKKIWKLLSKWLMPVRNTNTNVIVICLLWLHSLIVVKIIYHEVSNQIYSSKNACNAWLSSTFVFAPLSGSFYFSPFTLSVH